MICRLLRPCRLAAAVLLGVAVPGAASAQVAVGAGVGPGWGGPGGWTSPGGPVWTYPGLPGGPYAPAVSPFYGGFGAFGGYGGFFPGFRGATGSYWTNGLSLYGPPIPTYGPIPGVFGANDLNRQWAAHPSLAWNYGWIGVYRASPRPRPPTVNVWAPVVVEGVHGPGPAAAAPAPAEPGGCLYLSVKVPQPAAEVYVDGVRTIQTGTDRIFESPPLDAGKEYRYQLTTRWVERGVTFEKTKVVTGKPGEVLRVDFNAPDVVVTGQ
jgi:uncharacterized protein (TIGR03000 family)